MPFAEINNTRLFYRLEGQSGLPVLVLSHSLGCDHEMWAPQMPGFLQYFQVLRYDARGHGASAVPAGDFTLDQLGQDALGLVDKLGIAKFAFCGLSMGGAVGQWLAINALAIMLRSGLPGWCWRTHPQSSERLIYGTPAAKQYWIAAYRRLWMP